MNDVDIILTQPSKLDIIINKEANNMSYQMLVNGKSMNVALKHFVADTYDDMLAIDKAGVPMGSTCYVIATETTYILNGKNEWVVKPNGSGGGGGIIPDPDTIYIYDGGSVEGW